MCGARFATFSLGLALSLLLCSVPLSAIEYDGPDLPTGWLAIHESELEELETILSRQETTIAEQARTLTMLRGTTNELQTTIERLGTSFDAYASGAQETIGRLQTEAWVYRGTLAVLTALTLYLAIR